MTEGYGSGHGEEGRRPSGRGAVTERLAGQPHGARELDLTDEATAREAAGDEAGRESSDPFEPADTRPGSSSIFDVDERDKQEELQPTGYEPPVADPDGAEDTGREPAEITPTPVPAADPPAGTPVPEGLPEPPSAAGADTSPSTDTAAAGTPAAADAPGSPLGSLDVAGIRNRFIDIQAGFVDEPRQAVEEAGRFVDDLVQQVADALRQQRGQLAGAGTEGSTEDLRLTLRAYRQFVDRLLGLAS